MRGTGLGPWIKLSVKPEDVEAPRQIEIQPEESPDHGLWNFFNPQRTILSTPVEESRHGMACECNLASLLTRSGRAWTREELRFQSFQRLHSLWWSCLKEQNRIATENATRTELQAGHGGYEANERMTTVRLIAG
jgi:large subunit ribosomal protein L47